MVSSDEDKDFFTWTPEQYDVIIDNCPLGTFVDDYDGNIK